MSCQDLVQTVAQMVSALPEDLEKVLSLADDLKEDMYMKSNPTCSADQISYLMTQRDWLEEIIEEIIA